MRAAEIGPAEEIEVDAASPGPQHFHHRGRIVEHEQAVPRHQHAIEEQHAILLIQHLQRMAPASEPARDRLARENLQAKRIRGDREREHAVRVVAVRERGGQRDVALVAVGGRGRELLSAGDDHAVSGFLDDVQRNLGVFAHIAPLVLRLLTAVDLRVAQRMGEKQVVLQAIFVVVLQVLAEIAFGMFDCAEFVLQVQRRDDVRRQNVGAAAELPPGQLVPELAVAALAPEGRQPSAAASRRRSSARRIPLPRTSFRRDTSGCSAGRRRAPARRS